MGSLADRPWIRKFNHKGRKRYVHSDLSALHAAPPSVFAFCPLHNVREHLVHPADLRSDAVVDCTVANLDDEPAEDVGLDLFSGEKGSQWLGKFPEHWWEPVGSRAVL